MSCTSRGAGRRPARAAGRRHGQSLIEFAVVALVTYLLLAAIITFGFMFYAAQGTQSTADFLARELSRAPLPAGKVDLRNVLYGNPADPSLALSPAEQDAIWQFRARVFDPHYLVLAQADVLDEVNGGLDQAFVGSLPIVNQQLIPLMINDQLEEVRYFRYPGAVYQDSDPADDPRPPAPAATGLLVRIPMVVSRGEFGVEEIDWRAVVEPVLDASGNDAFPVTSAQMGLVALRLNYPVQSSVMSSFRHDAAAPDYPFEPTIGRPNAADDGAVTNGGGPWAPDGPLVASDNEFGAYAGAFGLGRQVAFASEQFRGTAAGVRPFRRVISAQAVYRREVFN